MKASNIMRSIVLLFGTMLFAWQGLAAISASNFTLTGPNNGSVALSWNVSGSASGGIFGGMFYANGIYNVAISRATTANEAVQNRVLVVGEDSAAYMKQTGNSGHVTDTPPATGQTYYYWLHFAPYSIIDDTENFYFCCLSLISSGGTISPPPSCVVSSSYIGPIPVFVPAPSPTKFTVTFNSNDGNEDMAEQEFEKGVSQALKKNDFSRSGYEFQGWSTAQDGDVAYEDEQQISIDTDLTLYAVWRDLPVLVSFDPNGGEGEMEHQKFEIGKKQKLNKNKFWNAGYIFMGWAKDSAGAVVYRDEAEITVDSDTTLYAVWDALKLEITEVDWLSGSVTLDWSKTESGESVTWPCTLYRSTTDDFNSAVAIAEGVTDTSYRDDEFLKVEPVIKPLYYWVKPVTSEISYAASDALRTRYRSGLFVGFSNYANNPTTGKPWQGAYASMWPTTASVADMFDSFGFECNLIRNPSSQILSRAIAERAVECNEGDIFLLWIFTHGGTFTNQNGRQTSLAMEPYLDRYFSSRMVNDMSAFKRETAVVPIIYACHSGGMLDSSDASLTFDIMEFVNLGLAQCHNGQGGIAACSSKVISPAVDGLATDIDSFARFFIDSVDCADNGDGNLTLHEMVTYIQKQQGLFTPYAIAEEVNGGILHASLIMKENAKKVTGAPPSKPTGLRFVENNDGSVTFMWDAASGAKWYSDQGLVTNKNGFLYETSVTYDSMPFKQGESYTFIVYAGNEFGRSDGASIIYSPSKGFVRLDASRNLSNGIKLSWDTNIGEGVVSKWVLFHPGGWFTSPERIAELPNTLKSCFHNIDDFQEHEYYIVGYDNTEAEVVCSNVVTGRRVEVLSPSLSISPSSIEIPADCGGMEGCYFEIDVTADMTWSFRISDDSFCKDYFVDTGNTGRIYMYCRKNETPNTRSVVITVSIRKPDGSSIEKECVVIQRGNGESYPYEGSISRWRKQNGDMSENEFLTGQNSKGVPYLMCYAFQGNIADDEVPKLKIEMDDNGKPSISMPAQNPLTSLDVEVTLESSVDLQTWKNVIEDKDVELSDDGRRVIRFPRKNGNTEFFRFKVDLR